MGQWYAPRSRRVGLWRRARPRLTTKKYCESTAVTAVYSCRFILVRWDEQQVTRVECIGRVSTANGLVGRWRQYDQDDEDVVMEIPFQMPVQAEPAPQQQPQEAVRTTATSLSPIQASRVNRRQSMRQPRSGGPQRDQTKREMVFRGNTVDARGAIYETRLFLTLWDDGRAIGVSHESGGRECPVVGTWDGSGVKYRMTFPFSTSITTVYDYEGVLHEDATGEARFIGTWKFEREASARAIHPVLDGIFEFQREQGVPANNTRSRTRAP